MRTRLQRPVGIAWTLVLGLGASAQQWPPDPPREVIASWWFDPAMLGPSSQQDPNRQLVESRVVAFVSAILNTGRNPAAVLEPLLGSQALGESPYRLTLLSLAVDSGPDPRPGKVVKVMELQAVLEIDAEDHQGLIAALKQVAEDRGWNIGNATELQLRAGEGKTIPSSDPVQDLSWAFHDGNFLVGFGRGALERWFDAGAGGAWLAHRRAVEPRPGPATRFLEAFVDLDAVRREVPDQAGWGTIGELLAAWRISNARSVMLHGFASGNGETPRLLELAISWSSRAEPTGKVHAQTLTETHWPAALGPPPQNAEYALVFAADWPWWVGLGLSTYQALAPEDPTFARRARQWLQRYTPILDRATGRMGGFAAAVGYGGPASGPVLIVPWRHPAPSRAKQDLETVLASLEPQVQHDASQQAWRLILPACSGKEYPLWLRLTPHGLIGAWDPAHLPAPEPTSPARPGSGAGRR